MSTPKSDQKRDVAVPIAPGEFIHLFDLPNLLPWKRVLGIAAEELPDFLPSLLAVPDDVRTLDALDAHVARWLARWRLADANVPKKLARNTLIYRAQCAEKGIAPRQGLHMYLRYQTPPGAPPPAVDHETTWTVGGETRPIFRRAYAAEVDKRLLAADGRSVLSWNPYQETRADAAARLRQYLDLALAEIAHQCSDLVASDGTAHGRMRIPKLVRRHIVWFVRWKFAGESLYRIYTAAPKRPDGRPEFSDTAVRKAVDRVADVLDWGRRRSDEEGT